MLSDLKLVRDPSNQNQWFVRVIFIKELDDYRYPYQFPRIFLNPSDKYQLQVYMKFVQVISNLQTKKQFNVEQFLNSFNVPNKKMNEIKIFF